MQENKDKRFSDLKAVRTKRIRARYFNSSYKISISNKKNKMVGVILAVFLLVFIGVIFFKSSVYKKIFLIYSLKNQTMLVGFQNSAELRPTGGFWGSFALWKIDSSVLKNKLYFDTNPYKKDNSLMKESSIELPKPMKETWPDRNQSFVNANWQVDFPETAKSLQWFLHEGWNEKTDGVIAISSLAIIDLLKLTGPITLSDNTTVSSDNFTKILSEKIDKEYWQESENLKINEPKTILKEFSPELIERTKKLGFFTLYRYFTKQAESGRILFYSNSPKQQKLSKELNISGELKTYALDYVYVNNANLNGGKSSLNVKEKIVYSIEKGETNPVGTLNITRTCNDSWPNILNRNYARALVPLGSKLISAELENKSITKEIEIGQESNSTSFGFWFSTSPDESQQVTIKYELPFDNFSLNSYHLIWQKQPGTIEEIIQIKKDGQILFEGDTNQNSLSL
ncbi:MAG: DUF4012 domain-containing protein [bacterium]